MISLMNYLFLSHGKILKVISNLLRKKSPKEQKYLVLEKVKFCSNALEKSSSVRITRPSHVKMADTAASVMGSTFCAVHGT